MAVLDEQMERDRELERDRDDYLSVLRATHGISGEQFKLLKLMGFFERRQELTGVMSLATTSVERRRIIREIQILNLEFQEILYEE